MSTATAEFVLIGDPERSERDGAAYREQSRDSSESVRAGVTIAEPIVSWRRAGRKTHRSVVDVGPGALLRHELRARWGSAL